MIGLCALKGLNAAEELSDGGIGDLYEVCKHVAQFLICHVSGID